MCARFCTSLCEIESCRHLFSKVWALCGPPSGWLRLGLRLGLLICYSQSNVRVRILVPVSRFEIVSVLTL